MRQAKPTCELSEAESHADDIAFAYALTNAALDAYDRTDPRSDRHSHFCSDPFPCRHARPSGD